MGSHEQSARRSGQRKPNAFQNMGKSAYARSHRRNLATGLRLGHFSAVWKQRPRI
jgi:hypothetical protein